MTPAERRRRIREIRELAGPLLFIPMLLCFMCALVEQFVNHDIVAAWGWCGVFVMLLGTVVLLYPWRRGRGPR